MLFDGQVIKLALPAKKSLHISLGFFANICTIYEQTRSIALIGPVVSKDKMPETVNGWTT